jgi:rhodanese-related sulfurtransferase
MSVPESELLANDPRVTIINAGKHQGNREIRGAIRYSQSELLEADHLALPIARERPVVLYSEHGHDEMLERLAAKMRADGFSDVRIYDGSLADYEAAGGETQEPSLQQEIPPSD